MNRVETSDAISSVFYDWLAAEVRMSHIERNQSLDKLSDALEGLHGGWEHPKNFTAIKHRSHVDDRYPLWWETYQSTTSEDPHYDLQSAQLIFNALMQVSGSFRNSCFIRARTQAHYLMLRHRAVGVVIPRVVGEVLGQEMTEDGNLEETGIDDMGFKKEIDRISGVGGLAVRRLCARREMGYIPRDRDYLSMQYMNLAQRRWLELATEGVVLAARNRGGDLSAVPFLEPRSITDQTGTIHYPFREKIDWAKVLAT